MLGRGAFFWIMLFIGVVVAVVVVGGGIYIAVQQGAVDLNDPPDMQVTMSAAPETVAAGGSVMYTVDYTNAGGSPAGSVTMTVTMPSGITVGTIVPSAACTDSGGAITCKLGTQTSGKTGKVTVEGTVGSLASGTQLSANATIEATTTRELRRTEDNTANNSASALVTVQ